MAIQTRYAGDAQGINNFDAKTDGTLGTIISTGLTKAPTALKINGMGTFTVAESGTGGSVETILRTIGIDSTITMYQVDSTQLSVLLEATGSSSATIQARIVALGSNIGISTTINAANAVVSSTNGFKLA
jgi:hypothetical protein